MLTIKDFAPHWVFSSILACLGLVNIVAYTDAAVRVHPRDAEHRVVLRQACLDHGDAKPANSNVLCAEAGLSSGSARWIPRGLLCCQSFRSTDRRALPLFALSLPKTYS